MSFCNDFDVRERNETKRKHIMFPLFRLISTFNWIWYVLPFVSSRFQVSFLGVLFFSMRGMLWSPLWYADFSFAWIGLSLSFLCRFQFHLVFHLLRFGLVDWNAFILMSVVLVFSHWSNELREKNEGKLDVCITNKLHLIQLKFEMMFRQTYYSMKQINMLTIGRTWNEFRLTKFAVSFLAWRGFLEITKFYTNRAFELY